MSKITEKTLIPLSLVITIAGGVFGYATLAEKVHANEIKISKSEDFQSDVIDRLARIETLLKQKLNK